MHQLPTLAQEEQNALLVDHTHALLTLFDEAGRILHVNPACQHILGYQPADVLNSVIDDLVHPDDLPRLHEAWEQVLNAGDAQCTCRVRHQNGAWRWLETRATLAQHHDQCYVITVAHDITEHKQAEDEWQRGNELFRIMVESVKEYAIFATDTNGQIVSWNTGAERVFGYRENEIIGQDAAIIFTPEDRAAGAHRQELHTAATAGHAQDERWHLRKDGSRFWANGMTMPLRGETGAMRGFVKVARDDTARKQVEHEREQLIHTLDAQRARLDTVLESISDAFYAVDKDFCFTYINKQSEAWWGRQRDTLIGQHYWTMFPQALGTESYHKHLQVMRERQPVRFETFSPLAHRWIMVSIYPAQDGGLSVYFQDITARKHAEDQLRHQAGHDALTGLPNRATLLDHVRRALARHQRHSEYCFAVLFLDLDRFKIINDSLGHHIGDQLLITTARRLQACVRPEDVVARLGGDEFVILLDSVHDVHAVTMIANRIHAAIAAPMTLDEHDVATSTSIGITLSDASYAEPEELLRDADTAMYRAKRRGPGRHAIFDRSMHAQAMERLWMESAFGRALERHEFRLDYQPLVELASGRVRGFEALVRWHHPLRGIVAPDTFVPVAEETGFIHALGQWVLREACRQMQAWHTRFPGVQPWIINVNLSSVQFHNPELAAHVAQILHETGLAPRYLQLEMTESVMLEHNDGTLALLRDLQALGVTLALDDFGTGYSSLSSLHRFPINTLKIDRSFITTLDACGEHGELVRAIIALGHNLGMNVVAEGIETAAQRDKLAALECGRGQGYFFAKPMQAAAVNDLLAAEHEREAGRR